MLKSVAFLIAASTYSGPSTSRRVLRPSSNSAWFFGAYGRVMDGSFRLRPRRRRSECVADSKLFAPLHLVVAKTIDKVIVHHDERLHVGLHDRGAHEAESAFLQILAELVGLR